MRCKVHRWLVCFLLLPVAAGCAGTATVSGTASYDGQPIARGKIRFLPLDAKGQLDPKGDIVGADIVDGRYKAMAVPMGKKKVAIDARQLAAEKPPPDHKRGPGPAEPLLPAEVTRDLAVEINAAEQTENFDLKNPGKAP